MVPAFIYISRSTLLTLLLSISGIYWSRTNEERLPQNAMTTVREQVWPTTVIYYWLDREFRSDFKQRSALYSSLQTIESGTCFDFIEIDPDRSQYEHAIEFQKTQGYRYISYVGYRDHIRVQEMIIGTLRAGKEEATITHEVFHLLGRLHEHSRTDRDQYVRVVINDVTRASPLDYVVIHQSSSQGLPYDYSSIMHYAATAGTTYSGNPIPIITPVNESIPLSLLGSSTTPTKYDYLHINLMYCGATELMIKNFTVKRIATFIQTNWDMPKYLPSLYTQTLSCSLVCDKTTSVYTHQSLSGNSTTKMFIHKRIYPGSKCHLTFKSVYNPAAKDPGKIRTVITPSIRPKMYPHGLIAEIIDTTWIKFSWKKLPCSYQHGPINGYRIELYRDNQKELSGTLPGADSTEFIAECLHPLTHYKVRVAAVNDAGIGLFSPFIEVTTEELDPDISRVSLDVASGRVRYTC